ncbi:MAG: hypothetical protein ACR2QO_05645 [Acidimicrobiales bacterium]
MSTLSIRLPRSVIGVATIVLVMAILTSPAAAHDPIFLTDDQSTPDTGPYLPDGTISFALYGSLNAPGETRGFEFDLRDGDDLYLSILIPDLEPELSLADSDLPSMTLVGPDGDERQFAPDIREPFADPFSGTNYVTLFETQEPAVGGRYQVVVTGEAPTRFVVAVGTSEEFFTPAERAVDRPTSFPGIAEPLNVWYTSPADGSEPVNAEPAPGEGVEVDEELIQEELAKLEEAEEAAAAAATDEPDGATAEAGAAGVDDGDVDDEVAGVVGADSTDDDASLTWLAPVAIALAAGAGGALAFRRRRANT